MSIHAFAARKLKGTPEAFSYEPAPLAPHEIEIRISHCGICHSDVHLVDGDWGVGSYPMVPGHEIVGTVAALGPEVAQLQVGDRVGVGWQRSACLSCEACGHGDENLCAANQATCVGHRGGFADRIQVDARFAFPIPAGLALEAAAPLLCGGVTVYSPLRRLARPSMRVGVVGIGGRPAIREMLEMATRHGVAAKVQVRPLAQAGAALDEVRQGRARYRVVLTA